VNLPNVIGIAGQQGSGKDTAALWFIERGYGKSSFADPIKWMLNQAFGWSMADWENREWKEGPNVASWGPNLAGRGAYSPRFLAQWLGTDVVRNNFGQDAWVNLWKQRWHDTGQPRVVVADVRFQNECDAIHKLGGIVLRITRKNDTSGDWHFDADGDPVVVPHESERTNELRNIDHIVENDGTIPELYETLGRTLLGDNSERLRAKGG
jgi:hypothetical protein